MLQSDKLNLNAFLNGAKIILTYNPLDTFKLWALDDTEQGRTVRYALYMLNFICANLGIIIMLISAYAWFTYVSPNLNSAPVVSFCNCTY